MSHPIDEEAITHYEIFPTQGRWGIYPVRGDGASMENELGDLIETSGFAGVICGLLLDAYQAGHREGMIHQHRAFFDAILECDNKMRTAMDGISPRREAYRT